MNRNHHEGKTIFEIFTISYNSLGIEVSIGRVSWASVWSFIIWEKLVALNLETKPFVSVTYRKFILPWILLIFGKAEV